MDYIKNHKKRYTEYIFHQLLFYFLFFIIISYQSFHYIMKFSAEGTSPTYSNTPMLWQTMKYVLITFSLMVIYINIKYIKKINKSIFLLIIAIVYISMFNAINQFRDISELKYVYLFVVCTPLLFLSKYSLNILFKVYVNILLYFALFLIISNIIVILNYLIFDRLPAQAYAGTLMIRFAGLYDMPNGFGMLNVFLFYYFIFKGNKTISFFLFINIIFTLSGSTLLVFFIIGFIYNIHKIKFFTMFMISIPIIFSIGYYYQDILLTLYKLKLGSWQAHFDMLKDLVFFPILHGGLIFNESFVVSFFLNYFPVSIFIILLIIYIAIRNKNNIFGLYIIVFFIASMFISQIYIFPNNILFIINLIFLLRKKGINYDYRL